MTRPELDLVFDWVAAEGWNPGLHDAECLWRLDPNGLLPRRTERRTRRRPCRHRYWRHPGLSRVFTSSGPGSGAGVAASYCGRRPWRIWESATWAWTRCQNQEANYRKSGFRAAHRHLYFLGRGGGEAPAGLTPLSRKAWGGKVVAYDRLFSPEPRPDFLRCWLSRPSGAALGAVREGRLAGYGVIRPCRRGFKVGPLFADDTTVAMDLFQGFSPGVPHAPVILNVPEVNPGALDLAKRFGLQPVFATTRMYTRGEHGVPLGRVYGHDLFKGGA